MQSVEIISWDYATLNLIKHTWTTQSPMIDVVDIVDVDEDHGVRCVSPYIQRIAGPRDDFEPAIMEIHRKHIMRYIMRMQTELRVRGRGWGDKTRARRKLLVMGIITHGYEARLRFDSRPAAV